ncbi:hypothetical protein HaLaN_14215, partial [Haematococcus lacustris]
PEDPDSDILDRDEALQPDLTEAERNRKVSGEARAAGDRDNTYHGRKSIPRYHSDSNMVDHVGKQLETDFSNMPTLLFAGRLKKSVSLAGAKPWPKVLRGGGSHSSLAAGYGALAAG